MPIIVSGIALAEEEGMGKSVRLLLCMLAISAAASVAAQEKGAQQLTSAEWRTKIQADKKGIVERAMKLTAEEGKKFWPLYDSFQRELEKPNREYAKAVVDYVAAGESLTDANAKRLAEQVLAASIEESRLRQKHFKRLQGVLPGIKAARYVQVENKIQAVLRYEIAAAIPLAQ